MVYVLYTNFVFGPKMTKRAGVRAGGDGSLHLVTVTTIMGKIRKQDHIKPVFLSDKAGTEAT